MEEFPMDEYDEFVDFEFLNEDLRPLELKFPEDKTDLMIDAIRQRAALWNIKDLHYRNRVVRNSLWQEVLSEMDLEEAFRNLVKKRWDTLKSGYTRYKKGAPSGSGARTQKYKYGERLSFLDDTIEPRRTTTMMSPASRSENSLELAQGTAPKTRKRLARSHEFQAEALEILKDMNKPRATPPREKSFAALTCELICKDMETLPDSEQRTLRTELFAAVDAAIRRNRSPGQ